ncbi:MULTISPECIES: GNAT family N-acetyltransferase [unclassified Marinobacter]|uniref:GNAT family N-acetyltransferase n=1 Tax=unclassified Marinobacter TaxID=83889 RepID=UPI001926348B|nr:MULTISPECIES: GNAT family N-acetyltransferase [unclassified Marinobacter]MBL3825405.1 GNAT family N-acetyltransferase [Marinobacter sp. MC3]MBL3893911.1 GNAT family N-acetyltransferase [Marinobacter sp. MW3]
MSIRFRKYSWQLAPASIRDIRQQVFIEEQKVPPELEWDETDEIADHYLAVLPDNTPAGVARLFSTLEETGHIGRMAILPQYRGHGIGEALLRHLIAESADRFSELRLSAQEHAIPFYQRSGFHVCSGVYDDAGIPHFDMRCLAPDLAAESLGTKDQPMILGSDTDSWLFDTEARLLGLMDSVVGQAGQRIWLYDRLLEHDLYDRHRFRELISALARRHRLSEVRLLIHDDKPLVKRRHALVELMRRLPSRMELRLVNEDYPVEDQPFILADREGVVYRHDFYKPEGFAKFSDGGRVKLLSENFQRMWDAARPSLELRELPL